MEELTQRQMILKDINNALTNRVEHFEITHYKFSDNLKISVELAINHTACRCMAYVYRWYRTTIDELIKFNPKEYKTYERAYRARKEVLKQRAAEIEPITKQYKDLYVRAEKPIRVHLKGSKVYCDVDYEILDFCGIKEAQ